MRFQEKKTLQIKFFSKKSINSYFFGIFVLATCLVRVIQFLNKINKFDKTHSLIYLFLCFGLQSRSRFCLSSQDFQSSASLGAACFHISTRYQEEEKSADFPLAHALREGTRHQIKLGYSERHIHNTLISTVIYAHQLRTKKRICS